MQSAETLAILAAGSFFLVGLLTGVWKYQQIHGHESAEAHPYVNIAHRTALLYAFACLLLAQFARLSALSDTVNTVAVAVQVVSLPPLSSPMRCMAGWQTRITSCASPTGSARAPCRAG